MLIASGAQRNLLTHLPSDLIHIVLRFSSELLLGDRCQVVRTLARCLSHDPSPDLVATLKTAAGVSVAEEEERERALVALAARMLDEGRDEDEGNRILTAGLSHVTKPLRGRVVSVDLIPLLPHPSRSQVVATALRKCFDAHRPSAVDSLLGVLEGDELRVAFNELERIADSLARAAVMVIVLRRAGTFADRSTTFRDVDMVGGWPSGITRAELTPVDHTSLVTGEGAVLGTGRFSDWLAAR